MIMDFLDIITRMAGDLTAAISTGDRYGRLLEALHRVIPYDVSALLRLDGNLLVPIAARGLAPEAMGRRFSRKDHPRLDIICNSESPVLFPTDTDLPDPFDGLLAANDDPYIRIHACLGCPLFSEDRLIGALTADALDPRAFDRLDLRFLEAVSALAGAQMQTVGLIEALERNAEKSDRIAEDLMREASVGGPMVGRSGEMKHLKREIELVAKSDFTVLVLGETGVGKELVVRAIHAASPRSSGPILYLNCAALPETLSDSELFGHTRGAFTGATSDRPGKFELADGGTLFLDEIGELPLSIQAKLLRAIQEGEIQRVGSDRVVRVNVRLLSATNRDLEAEVGKGGFRADLFHRLNVYPLRVPPLRERKSDIPVLAGFFCERIQRRLGTGPVRLSPDAMAMLTRYTWPGNVRELENVISRAILKASFGIPRGDGVVIVPDHLGRDLPDGLEDSRPVPAMPDSVHAGGRSLRESTKAFQAALIRDVLDRNGGNWAAAARQLKIDRSNLYTLAGRLEMRGGKTEKKPKSE